MLPPPPPVLQKTPADVGITVEFLRNKAPFLARDLAMQLAPGDHLAQSYGLTPAQWNVLSTAPMFLDLIQKAHEDLSGPEGVAEKVRRKAALIIENVGLMDMATIMADPKATASNRIDAFSQIVTLAGLNKNATSVGQAGVGGPLIQINVSNDGKNQTITVGEDKPALEHDK